MSDPKKQGNDDDDYDEKMNKLIDAKIKNLEDIKEASEDEGFKEKLENQIQNLKDAK